ncbi:MAG: hypothetical protein KIG75_00790 [Bacteroidales bacterium]|nr:hypothetical protein [Bacteroidales bacterium]
MPRRTLGRQNSPETSPKSAAPYPRATEQPQTVAQKFLPESLSLYPALYRSGGYPQGSCLKVTLAPEDGGRE